MKGPETKPRAPNQDKGPQTPVHGPKSRPRAANLNKGLQIQTKGSKSKPIAPYNKPRPPNLNQ